MTQSPHLHPSSSQANSPSPNHSSTIILHQNHATERGMCPVYPCPPQHAASTFFAAITVMADRPSSFRLPPTPRDHMLKAMIVWLLMQFCNDRDHNQRDFDYSLLKMRQRLLFTASLCPHQSYDFLALPEVMHNLRFPSTALSEMSFCPTQG